MTRETIRNKNQHTISFLVTNKPGVLVRIAQVFARRGYNIDALVVSPSVNPQYSRMTITAQGDPSTLDQIIKQTAKLVDVLHVGEHALEDSVIKELAFLKVKAKPHIKTSLSKLMKEFHAHIVDETDQTLIIEQTGTSQELDEFEALIKTQFGIVEMVRTGKLVMARGKEST